MSHTTSIAQCQSSVHSTQSYTVTDASRHCPSALSRTLSRVIVRSIIAHHVVTMLHSHVSSPRCMHQSASAISNRAVGAQPPHLPSLSPRSYQPRSIARPSSPNPTGPTNPMSPQQFSLGRSHACGPHSPRACTRAERSPPAARVAELPECICPSTITRTSPCPSVAAPIGGSRYPPWPHRRPWPRSWPRASLGY